ncbi:transcriptional regulator, GntR family [Shewanella psychrophila]|uniref:Transcriptional regulator, GntR family n=1 Tax=Shewanella psychrophila TaxID=225848 RepID=A0A1S6HM42_9GAMM|nr:PLP-dependent aminotransferase family protein [Shewanella psychrophila]AQS36572.1 transcriptional regulator, GntR family [Shewanella psychrophila]
MGTMWNPDLDAYLGPKYLRLFDAIEAAINRGELESGVKLPPQRRLADNVGFTIGTVTRAYALAEQKGLVEARVGAGTFVKPQFKPASAQQQANFATCQQPLTNQIGALSDALTQLAKDPHKLSVLLGYHPNPLPEQQFVFHQWLSKRGITQSSEDLLFTHGAQQGIYVTLNGLLKPGDTLLHEANCYPGIRLAAQQLGVHNIGVPLTHDGLDLEALAQLVVEHQPKIIYLTLNNQNPTCIQYSDAQRETLLHLAQQHDFYIIEDDVNYCLPQEWKAPLWNLALTKKSSSAPQRVIYLSSLSKLFSGGLRQGFLLIPEQLRPQIKLALHSQCWMISPLNIELATKLITTKSLMGDREKLIAQRQAMCIDMSERLGLKNRWRGLTGWLQLKSPVKAHHVVTSLASSGILIRNGDDFDNHDNYIRLSIGGASSNVEFEASLLAIESCILNLTQNAYSIM